MMKTGPYVFLLDKDSAGRFACKSQHGCRKVYLPGGRETETGLKAGIYPNLEKQVWEQGWRIVELGKVIDRDPYGEDGMDEVIWMTAKLAQRPHFVGKFYPIRATGEEVMRHDWLHENVLEDFDQLVAQADGVQNEDAPNESADDGGADE